MHFYLHAEVIHILDKLSFFFSCILLIFIVSITFIILYILIFHNSEKKKESIQKLKENHETSKSNV